MLKAQEEMKEKKQELELSVLSQETNWVHKILDRKAVNDLTAQVQKEIEAEDEEMS